MKTSAISKESEKVRTTESVGDPLLRLGLAQAFSGRTAVFGGCEVSESMGHTCLYLHMCVCQLGNLRCSADSQKGFRLQAGSGILFINPSERTCRGESTSQRVRLAGGESSQTAKCELLDSAGDSDRIPLPCMDTLASVTSTDMV